MEKNDDALIHMIANKQFDMIGEPNVSYQDFPEDGVIIVGKKKVKWWEYYFFKDKEQYEEWKEWAIKTLKKVDLENNIDMIDMTYGLNYRLVKEKAQLSLGL